MVVTIGSFYSLDSNIITFFAVCAFIVEVVIVVVKYPFILLVEPTLDALYLI